MDQKRIRRRKEWLYERYPFCPTCGIKMVLNEKGQVLKVSNLATIEHLNNRYDPTTRQMKQSKEEKLLNTYFRIGRTILLCKKCNNGTLKEAVPITTLWRKSQSYPYGILGFLKRIYYSIYDFLNYKIPEDFVLTRMEIFLLFFIPPVVIIIFIMVFNISIDKL